jgi:hypothetical protein
MTFKPTIISTPATGSTLAPTRTVGMAGEGATHAEPAPSVRPTAIKPTAIPGATAPATKAAPQPAAMKPTGLPYQAPAPAVVPAEHVKASVMPGTQRKPLDVSIETLTRRFPGTSNATLVEVHAVLAGVCPQTMDMPAWLRFGVPAQEQVSTLVKARLALLESAETRAVTQHLSRLNTLLREVLDAMEGGLLRRSVAKVWESVVSEVRQLETLLSQAGASLVTLIGELEKLIHKNEAGGEALQAHALAADYLFDVVAPEIRQLMTSRQLAMTTSQALTIEQIQTLALDKESVKELMTLVQDGVLLQLPAVYSQLAGLSAVSKPSDTQRFLAAEKLTEIVQFIQRKM